MFLIQWATYQGFLAIIPLSWLFMQCALDFLQDSLSAEKPSICVHIIPREDSTAQLQLWSIWTVCIEILLFLEPAPEEKPAQIQTIRNRHFTSIIMPKNSSLYSYSYLVLPVMSECRDVWNIQNRALWQTNQNLTEMSGKNSNYSVVIILGKCNPPKR